MLKQPKQYINRHSEIRHKAIGPERRLNAVLEVMDKSTILPKAVTYEDIDQAVFDWVDKELDIVYDGKSLPTYKLFSNQRLSEYNQTWSYTDAEGNVSMNFKTITRDNNPQKGEGQGMFANVPGEHGYSLFKVPVLQENGDEVWEVYSIKQPVSVNFNYTVVMVCDKFRLLNELNMKIHDKFKSLECYIFPNGHAMPMLLDSIADESEYTINDRKYYSQAYSIKLMGYVIKPDDYSVVRVPSKFKIGLLGTKAKRGKKDKEEKNEHFIDNINENEFTACEYPVDIEMTRKKPIVSVIEETNPCLPDEESRYYYQGVTLDVEFPVCEDTEVNFELDISMEITGLTTTNVHDFKVEVNGVIIDFEEDEPKILKDDKVRVVISKENELEESTVSFTGYNPDVILDKRTDDPESILDQPVTDVEIIVKNEDDNGDNN